MNRLWPAAGHRAAAQDASRTAPVRVKRLTTCDQAFVADLVLRHSDQFNAVTARVAAAALRPRGCAYVRFMNLQ
jgi:hypothetical protein